MKQRNFLELRAYDFAKKYSNINRILQSKNDITINDDLTNKSCKELKRFYKINCNRSNYLINMSMFFEQNWYNNKLNEIHNANDLKSLKIVSKTLKDLKVFFKKENYENPIQTMEYEGTIDNCIIGRIEYTDRCIENPDRNHDMEILQKIFIRDRLVDLKYLFNEVVNKSKIAIQEAIQEAIQDYDEIISNTDSSGSWETVVKTKYR